MKKLLLIILIMGCTTEPTDCAGVENGTAVVDDCGVCGGNGTSCVTDIDGNVYETVQIGEQLWMAENLKTTKYRDGSAIPTGYSYVEWANLYSGAYDIYPADDDSASIATCGDNCSDIYGNLYNWYALGDVRGICPEGWHISSDAEWMELEIYLGMCESGTDCANDQGWRGTDEGSQLAGNADLWNDSNLESNSKFGTSGFTVLPSGCYGHQVMSYDRMGLNTFFWTSSEYDIGRAWFRTLYYDYSAVSRTEGDKQKGFSIRCLKD